MKKKAPDRHALPVFLKKMWISVHLLLVFSLSYAAAQGEAKRVTLNVKSEALNDVLIKLKDQTGIEILFNKQLVGEQKCSDLKLIDCPVDAALAEILGGTGFGFSLVDGVYVIKKNESQVQSSVETLRISGTVVDSEGMPLPGVTIVIKGTSLGGTTDKDGKFKLSLSRKENVVLVFSFVGMRTKEVAYDGQAELKVVLDTNVTEMEQVVVTGIFTRKAESYTGSATTIKKEELQKMGNQDRKSVV